MKFSEKHIPQANNEPNLVCIQMAINYDPAKIKIMTLDDNGVAVDSGKTLADHIKECPGCPYCD